MSNTVAITRYKKSDKGVEANRKSHLKTRYGIDIAYYDKLLAEQGNRCAVCDKHVSEESSNFSVDHDHNLWGPESVRGLLCRSCNAGIGKLGDSVDGLKRALSYMEKFYGKD